MIRNRSFAEVLAAAAFMFSVALPAILWTWFSIRDHKLLDFPASLPLFVTAAQGITVGLLGIQQFGTKDKTQTPP